MSLVLEHHEDINLVEELNSLENSREGIQALITQAQSELDEAKAKQKITGEYADADWFTKTKAIIREETVNLHNMNRRIKQIRSQMSRSNPKAAYFQQAAKKLLDIDLYKKVNDLSNEWMKQN